MTASRASGWLTLIISLPGRRGTARMRVWRALRAAGAAVLRDGVYLLPAAPRSRDVLEEQAQAVRAAGGSAQVLRIEVEREQELEFRTLFERGGDYAQLLDRIQTLQAQLRRRRPPDATRRAQVLRRELETVRVTDYFPGPAAEQVQEAMHELESSVRSLTSPGEPHNRTGVIEKRSPAQYRGRTWVTRARPWVDRLASAWLIRRFIDPKAKFLWLKDIKRCPKNALGFDFDGATFSHIGARVTFEHLLASFGLEQDTALVHVGRMVHCLDVGGAPVPEAQGLAAILTGARARLGNDNQLLAEASRVFDHLYRSCQEE
jgi:hypothetical protein